MTLNLSLDRFYYFRVYTKKITSMKYWELTKTSILGNTKKIFAAKFVYSEIDGADGLLFSIFQK